MSHFTVLVIGQDPEKQLQPFHEFECTGEVDEFVQSINKTEEARATFNASTERMVKLPAGVITALEQEQIVSHPVHGSLISRYASVFYVETEKKDALGRPEKEFSLPDGYEEIDVPTAEVENFADWTKGYYGGEIIGADDEPDLHGAEKWGWIRVDADGEVVEVIDRTNPNKKWDWYQLGGRWAGFFKMKTGVSGVKGARSLLAGGGHPEGSVADSAFKRHIDFDGMRQAAEEEAASKYDRIRNILEPHLPVTPWPEMRDQYLGESPALEGGLEAARKAYAAQPAVQAMHTAKLYFEDIEDYLADRATFIRQAGIQACMTFAVLKDGQWFERGSMGWWGCVADEKDRNVWIEEFGKLVAELPDDTLLSVYDCHI